MVFHALLEYCFGVRSINDAEIHDYHEYIVMTRPFHNLSHLDAATKLERFLDGHQKIHPDIFVVHNPSAELCQHFKEKEEYWTAEDEHGSTIIIGLADAFKERKESEQVTKLHEKLLKQLNPEGKTAFLCVDDLVIIAPHLNSDPEVSHEQVADFKRGLVGLLHNLPEHSLIVAGGFGSFLELEEGTIMEKIFSQYPAHPSEVTTRRKLTNLQTDFSQAGQLIERPADQILTTVNIADPKVVTFKEEEEAVDKLLPSATHPFEHFAVWARVHGK